MFNIEIDEGFNRYNSYLLTTATTTEGEALPASSTASALAESTSYNTKSTNKSTNNIKMSYQTREVEHHSLSACTVDKDQSIIVKQDVTNNQWVDSVPATSDNIAGTANNSTSTSITPVSKLPEGTTLRIAPMEWNCGGWADEHFHEYLKIPTPTQQTQQGRKGNVIVKLQAKARECVTVALSPQPNFVIGKTYAIHIGAAGNLQTVLRRRLPSMNEAVDISIATPKICSDEVYKSYWIILQSNGQLSVGVGKCPGVNCIGTLDDSMYHALRSGVDAIKYVGLGNSALGRKARDLKVRHVEVMAVPLCFKDQIVPLTPYNPLHNDDNNGSGSAGDNGGSNAEDAVLWAEYQKECEKAKKRAIKFKIEYKQPAPDAFFKWSEARRLRANPERGFITGIDIMSTEEKEKAGKRKQRFEAEERKNRELGIIGNSNGDDSNNNEHANDDQNGDNEMQDDNDNKGNTNNTGRKREPLPLEQAWDNLDLVEELRVDPPENLYLNPTTSDTTESDDKMDANDEDGSSGAVTNVPTKIHLFSIDWAAFKQIRTDDIMSYFSIYGPSYVEWLGELSCNVLFGDKYSAARAMEGMSRALPLEPPLLSSNIKTEDGGMEIAEGGGEEGAISIEKADDADNTEMKTSIDVDAVADADLNGDNTSTEVKNEMDNNMDNEMASANLNTKTPTNLGIMGWRFGNYPIRKRQDDRYGRRGTRSRILMRMANSLDVLDERPTSWPKAPPGFSTRHVLGPGSDFKRHSRKRGRGDREHSAKRRRRSDGGSYENRFNDVDGDDDETNHNDY
jgi:hypothetical protein